jgi:hypothetical protein
MIYYYIYTIYSYTTYYILVPTYEYYIIIINYKNLTDGFTVSQI